MENSSKVKKVKKKGGPINWLYDFAKITGAIPIVLWMRMKRYYPYGKPKLKGGILMTANHRSMKDPMIMLAAFPWQRIHGVATATLYRNWFTRFVFGRIFGSIKVDKENFSLDTFREVVERLNKGDKIFIFPEGRLNTKGESPMLNFKSGAIFMAYRAGAPILPVYIVKRDHFFQRQKVVIGTPIDIKEIVGPTPSMTEMTNASEFLKQKETELRDYYEKNVLAKKSKNYKNTF